VADFHNYSGYNFGDYLIYPVTRSQEWHTLRTSIDNGGNPVRRQKQQVVWTRFDITLSFFFVTPADSLVAFFNAHKGGLTSFAWTLPAALGSTVYTECVFTEDSLGEEFRGPNHWSYSLTILAYT
jgi:hypothetical protein